MKKGFTFVLSSFFTIFILILIVLMGSANAISISVQANNSNPQYNELVSFNAKVNIENLEKVPIQNLSVVVLDNTNAEVARCYFDINGNKLSNCDSSFESISQTLKNSTYDYGTLSAVDYNGVVTNFGYGYGYGYGSNSNLNQAEFEYNIAWRTPQIQNVKTTYSVQIEVNAQNSNVAKTYNIQTPINIEVEMAKPFAILSQNSFELEDSQVLIDASSSFDSNGYNLSSYKIYDGNELIATSITPTFALTLNPGEYNLSLIVTNQIDIDSLATNFNVKINSQFSEDKFEFNVDNYIDNSKIKFEILTLSNFQNKEIKLTPVIECIGIDFKYKSDFMDSTIILNEKEKTYSLFVDKNDFNLKIPENNDCTFKLELFDENTNEAIQLNDEIRFTTIRPIERENQVELNNGNDLINYVLNSFSQEFDKGYNILRFSFKNNGATDIDAEIKIIIQDLDYVYYEDVKVRSNSQTQVGMPLYIDENVQKGKYPIRISYKLGDGDLKTKYGYLLIE